MSPNDTPRAALSTDKPDPIKQKKGEDLRDFLERRRKDDLQQVMGSEQGRRVLYEILEITNYQGHGFDRDPVVMGRLQGKREIGCILASKLAGADAEMYLRMLKEALANAEYIKNANK